MNRYRANSELLMILGELIQQNPDLRFGQILQGYGFIKCERPAKAESRIGWQNEYYVEPDVLLERIKQRIRDYEFNSN